MMPEKRKLGNNQVKTNTKVILLDIEGTTTSISFVKDELFPYILENVGKHLTDTYEEDTTQKDIAALRDLAAEDKAVGTENVVLISDSDDQALVIKECVENVKWQMGMDRKSTALKQLQGHMWKDAYDKSLVKGHLYEEVASCMKAWHGAGKKVCIYSSGSVAAQKLLFKHSVAGDLLEVISAHFDTKVGGKRESQSYKRIAEELQHKPGDILFITDIPQEAAAAEEAGMESIIMLREGNAPLSEEDKSKYTLMSQFTQLHLIEDSKKAKTDSS